MTGDEARRLFAGAPLARLATVRADGSPHLVPIVFVVTGDVVHSAVDHKPKRTADLRRLANVAGDPRVCLLADSYDEDWRRLWWVRADGEARVLETTDPEAQAAIDRLVARYPQYAGRRPAGPVLAVTVTRWTGWTASS
jgi:PPOX class probable F420-dependent enzyme